MPRGRYRHQFDDRRLPTGIADPAERIRSVHQVSQAAKQMAEAMTAHQIMSLTETTPRACSGWPPVPTPPVGWARTSPTNLVVSNVPGSSMPLYAAGAVLERFTPIGPLLMDVGLNVTCFSYRGWMDFGFLSTPEIAGDLADLAEGIEPKVARLERAAGLRRGASRPDRRS